MAAARVPFSQSHVYTASRAFYARNQERAWISAVPFGVTTNAKLADAYARVVLAYLRDVEEAGETAAGDGAPPEGEQEAEEEEAEAAEWEGPHTVHIVEVAAGHGLFGYLLAKRLRELLSSPSSSSSDSCPWRVRLVMTDFQRSLLESRRASPWLEPFVADGSVDFAVLDASSAVEEEGVSGPLELLGGRILRPGRLRGPLIVLGNYALDSLPADVFFQFPSSGSKKGGDRQPPSQQEERDEEEDEENQESVVRELVVDPTTRRFHLADAAPSRLEAYPQERLLRAMLARGREGLHVVNVGLLSILRRLRALLHPGNRSE